MPHSSPSGVLQFFGPLHRVLLIAGDLQKQIFSGAAVGKALMTFSVFAAMSPGFQAWLAVAVGAPRLAIAGLLWTRPSNGRFAFIAGAA